VFNCAVNIMGVTVMLPDLFRGMGAQINTAETQQSGIDWTKGVARLLGLLCQRSNTKDGKPERKAERLRCGAIQKEVS